MFTDSVLFPYKNQDDAQHIICKTQHWLEKIVIALNLCPFAKAVYVKKQVRYAVSAARTEAELFEELSHEIEAIKAQPSELVDTTLLIHPNILIEFIDFHLFQQQSHRALKQSKSDGIIQIATFHPEFQFINTEPDDLENFTNRAPFPIHHLLREISIDRAVQAFPDTSEIYKKNIQTLNSLGRTSLEKLLNLP